MAEISLIAQALLTANALRNMAKFLNERALYPEETVRALLLHAEDLERASLAEEAKRISIDIKWKVGEKADGK